MGPKGFQTGKIPTDALRHAFGAPLYWCSGVFQAHRDLQVLMKLGMHRFPRPGSQRKH